MGRGDRVTGLVIFLASLLLLLPRIDFPFAYSFDEVHYVMSAKLLVPPQANYNWEHPPLAKYFIGLGIALSGDRPLGWRLMGIIFGALTISGIYVCALAIFRRRSLAVWAAAITFLNQVLLVQARTAMLDIYMAGFIALGMAAFCLAWDVQRPPGEVRGLLALSASMFALAAACKWFGLVPWIFLVLLWGVLRLLQRTGSLLFRRPREARTGAAEWYTAEMWRGVSAPQMVLCLVALPLAVYFATFVPLLWTASRDASWKGILLLQADMMRAQLSITGVHDYSSHWFQWPFDWKPIWYAFQADGVWSRGILLIGNPVILLPGFAAALVCAWAWWKERTRDAFLAGVWYWLLYLSFAVVPRKISFFYYYLPAACALSLCLAYVFHHYGPPHIFWRAWGRWVFLGVAVVVFALFLPILVGLPLPATFRPK